MGMYSQDRVQTPVPLLLFSTLSSVWNTTSIHRPSVLPHPTSPLPSPTYCSACCGEPARTRRACQHTPILQRALCSPLIPHNMTVLIPYPIPRCLLYDQPAHKSICMQRVPSQAPLPTPTRSRSRSRSQEHPSSTSASAPWFARYPSLLPPSSTPRNPPCR